MSEFPKTLYRDGSMATWDGRGIDWIVVDDAQAQEDATGYLEAAEFLATEAPAKNDDGSVDYASLNAKQIEALLPDMSVDELETLLLEEADGKRRKGVMAMIETEIAGR